MRFGQLGITGAETSKSRSPCPPRAGCRAAQPLWLPASASVSRLLLALAVRGDNCSLQDRPPRPKWLQHRSKGSRILSSDSLSHHSRGSRLDSVTVVRVSACQLVGSGCTAGGWWEGAPQCNRLHLQCQWFLYTHRRCTATQVGTLQRESTYSTGRGSSSLALGPRIPLLCKCTCLAHLKKGHQGTHMHQYY